MSCLVNPGSKWKITFPSLEIAPAQMWFRLTTGLGLETGLNLYIIGFSNTNLCVVNESVWSKP